MRKTVALIICIFMLLISFPGKVSADTDIVIALDTYGVPTMSSGTGWVYDNAKKVISLDGGYSFSFDGECSVGINNINGTITDGIFRGDVAVGDKGYTKGYISGGTYYGTITLKNKGYIIGGTFYGDVSRELGSEISGGTFYGTTDGWGSIKGGEFAISYRLNDGKWADDYEAPGLYTYGKSIKLPIEGEILREGYTFEGWYDNAEFSGAPITATSTSDKGTKVYYAKFTQGIGTWKRMGKEAVGGVDYLKDENGNYEIISAKGLAYIANIVNDGDSLLGKTVTLVGDIDLFDAGVLDYEKEGEITESNSWTPINGFAGIFDGTGHKISNLHIKANNKNAGLFGSNSGTIRDLEVSSGEISVTVPNRNPSSLAVGGIAAYSTGTIERCINAAEVRITGTSTAIQTIEVYAGGIAGILGTSIPGHQLATISDSSNAGKISADNLGADQVYVGGIVGKITNSDPYTVESKTSLIDHCSNEGQISGSVNNDIKASYVGGIAGIASTASGSKEFVEVRNCQNNGSISGVYSGGITGFCKYFVKINNNYNMAAVTGVLNRANVGGIVGLVNMTQTSISNCYNAGHVEENAYSGGIAGRVLKGTIDSCYWEDTSADSIVSEEDKNAEVRIITSYPFSSKGTDHDITMDNGKKQSLLDALNNWVSSNDKNVYLGWIGDKDNDMYPIFGKAEEDDKNPGIENDDDVSPDQKADSESKTGDDFAFIPILIILVSAMFSIAGISIIGRRRE